MNEDEDVILDDSRSPLDKRIKSLCNLQDRFRHFAVDGVIILILHLLLRELFFHKIVQTRMFDEFNYAIILFIIIYFTYYLFLETVFGRTIGHFINKTITLREFNEKIGFQRAFLRTIFRLIPFGFVTVILPMKRTLHDYLTQTYMVRLI